MPALTHAQPFLRSLFLARPFLRSLFLARSLALSLSLARSLAARTLEIQHSCYTRNLAPSSLYLPQPSPTDMVIRLRIYIHSPIRIHILLPHIRSYISFPPSFPPYLPCTSIPHSHSLSTVGLIKMVKMLRSRETSVLDC
jgi:hypothetical protein